MNDTTFENYQKRMLDAMQNPNRQSNDPFTKLSNILDNLKIFVNDGNYSQTGFKQEVENQFKSIDSSMVKPISKQVGSWSSVASIADECIAEIEKGIFHSK